MSNSSFKNSLKHLSCICHTHVMFMHMLTQNQPLHRVQCRAVLVSNRKCVWWTLTLRLCVADLWRFFYTSVPLTQNFVHNQVLHVKVFNSWNANRTLFIFYFISLFKCVFPWIVARRPNLPQSVLTVLQSHRSFLSWFVWFILILKITERLIIFLLIE